MYPNVVPQVWLSQIPDVFNLFFKPDSLIICMWRFSAATIFGFLAVVRRQGQGNDDKEMANDDCGGDAQVARMRAERLRPAGLHRQLRKPEDTRGCDSEGLVKRIGSIIVVESDDAGQ